MAAEVRPIRTKRDYEAALKEVDRLWGAKTGTREGDRLDVLATLIDAYEAEHYPISCCSYGMNSKGERNDW